MAPDDGPFDHVLQWVATCVVAGAVLSLAATVFIVGSPASLLKTGLLAGAVNGYRVGQLVDVPAVIYADSDLTVAVFIRGSCQACQSAKPLIGKLVDAAGKTSGTRVMLLVPDVGSNEIAYAQDVGLHGSVLAVGRDSVRARTVPTVLALTRTGRILFVNEGSLGETTLEQLLALLRPGGGRRH